MAQGNSLPMLEIADLRKSYGSVMALRGLSFSVPKGQIVGFLGPNGAGKSTTMKILTGYLPYNQGSAKVGGLEVREHADQTRQMIGYLPESNPQYEDMMVAEYLSFIADIRKIPASMRKEKIEYAVERCGLNSVFHKDISQLSKGYRQRVGLAQAILHSPQLLILDEPTSGLDPNQIIEIRNLIKDLGRETTVLMSTHIMQEAQSTCERILIIADGHLVADDTPDQLTGGNVGTIFMEVTKASGEMPSLSNFKERLLGLEGVIKVVDSSRNPKSWALEVGYEKVDPRRQLFEAVVDSQLVLLELRRQKASLEETFRRLTTKA
jgi:ABC-2 type transport system ATP-binding protein